MQLMGEGDTWELYVPSHMAYGDEGQWSEKRGQFVHPGAVLVFVLTLVKVKGPSKPKPQQRPTLQQGNRVAATQGVSASTDAIAQPSESNKSSPQASGHEPGHREPDSPQHVDQPVGDMRSPTADTAGNGEGEASFFGGWKLW